MVAIGGAILLIGCSMEGPNTGSPGETVPTSEWDSPGKRSSGESVHFPGECEPQAQGYWKRVCQKAHPSEERPMLSDYVALVSVVAPFTDVATVEDMCDRTNPSPASDKCEQAEAEFMTLLMNRASGRIEDACCVGGSGTGTVGEAIIAISTLLGNTDRTDADCRLAEAMATDVNGNTGVCPEEPTPDAGVPDAPTDPADAAPADAAPADPADAAPADPAP